MDKTRMLLLDKTAKCIALYTGQSNIKKHCRLQLKRIEKAVLVENKVLAVCFFLVGFFVSFFYCFFFFGSSPSKSPSTIFK